MVEDKVNILIVDDLAEKLLAMQAILEELGFDRATVARWRRDGMI